MSGKVVGLTGSTGFVGGHIVTKLLEQGYTVKCLVRDPDAAQDLAQRGLRLYRGDVTVPGSVDREFFAETSSLIHLVGIIREVGKMTFEKVIFEGTRTIVDLAVALGSIEKFVHMSALGTGADATSDYHRTKFQAEEYVKNSGLNYTIIRPSLIYGPGGELIETLIKLVRYCPIVPALTGGQLQPVYVRDVAACFVDSLTNPRSDGRTISIGGADRLSLRQIIETLLRVLGKTRLVMTIPTPLVRAPAAVMEALLPRPPITREQLTLLEGDNTCDLAEAEEVFPWFSPVGLEDGLREFLK